MRNLLLAATFSLGTVACAGGQYSAEVTTPSLVLIEPGIQVVVDSEVPIFYTDNYYWRYQDNTWYRSSYASSGWVRIEVIPQHLRRIERPQQYVRYRPRSHSAPAVVHAPPPRDHRAPPAPEIRDHRAPPPVARPPQQPPVHRDKGKKDKPDDKKDKKDKDDKNKDHRRNG